MVVVDVLYREHATQYRIGGRRRREEENVRGENENHRFKLTKNRVHAAGRRQLLHDLPHPAVLRGSQGVLSHPD